MSTSKIISKVNALLATIPKSLIWWSSAIIPITVFGIMGYYRLIDGDEGFYLFATKLVFNGKEPYLDFFYPQMPLLPYIYSLWFSITGISWISGRLFTSILACSTCILISYHAYKQIQNKSISIITIILFSMNSLIFGWFIVVKTYALSAFLLMGSVLLFLKIYNPKRIGIPLFISGLLLGMSIDTRLMIAGLVPIFCIAILLLSTGLKHHAISSIIFLSGITVSLLPLLYFACSDFSTFWFNNLGFHSMRSIGGLIGNFSQKFRVLKKLLMQDMMGFQNIILVVTIIVFRKYLSSSRAKFLIALIMAIFIINLLPTPTHFQYFCINIPFVLLLLIEGYRSWEESKKPLPGKYVLVILLLIYIGIGPLDIYRYTIGGRHVPGVDIVQNWKIKTSIKISNWLNNMANPGEPIVSWWPGYLIESHAVPVKKTENHFSWLVENSISNEDAEHYHIMKKSELVKIIKNNSVRFFIVNKWTRDRYNTEQLLVENNYKIALKLDAISIYTIQSKDRNNN